MNKIYVIPHSVLYLNEQFYLNIDENPSKFFIHRHTENYLNFHSFLNNAFLFSKIAIKRRNSY